MPARHFLTIPDFNKSELSALLDLADKMRKGEYKERPLAGKTLAMIFAKSSTRTRVSFEVGMYQLGGHALFLSSRDIQLGRGEPIRDTARVLSRYVDGIMIRTFDQAEVEELAKFGSVPVINGLTDQHHPCQILADLLTMKQHAGGWEKKVVAWIGDRRSFTVMSSQVAGSSVKKTSRGSRAPPERTRKTSGWVAAYGSMPFSRSRAPSMRRRRMRMIAASVVPRCSSVRSTMVPMLSVIAAS
jgi:ornithine carbamoyltransferase